MIYTAKGAIISECGKYRYNLWRYWGKGRRAMMFIGLNPSTADAEQDDPTIRRCVGFAQAHGCDVLYMTNLFAFRSTQPSGLREAADPVGWENDTYLHDTAGISEIVVAAWGGHPIARERSDPVRHLLKDHNLACLGRTKDGTPRHPLYLPKDTELTPWKSKATSPAAAQ